MFKYALMFSTSCLAISGLLFGDVFDEMDKFIEKARVQYKVPGTAVVIVKDDKIVFAKGYGLCRYDGTEKVDADTIFQLASVSKTFASAGIGVQVDQKKLTWDDELIDYLPQFALKEPYSTRYATPRDLMAHRTGLPAFKGDLLGKLGYTSQEVLYRVRFIEPATSFRNKAFYSNVGFFIAGTLLSQLTDATWEKTIQTTLLDPLKMRRTGFGANLENRNVAAPHALVKGNLQVITPDKSELFVAAGGVTSTANDMGNWMIMHLNKGAFAGKQILTPETVREMHTSSMVGEVSFSELPPIDEDSSFSYGLGWNNYNYKGKMIVEKGGGLDGVRTVVTLVPALKLGIVVLSNLNLTILPEVIRAHFLANFIAKPDTDLDTVFDKYEKTLAELVQDPQKPQDALPLGHSLSSYTGTFENTLYGTFVVSQAGEQLAIAAGPGRLSATLLPWSNDTFLLKWPTINAGHEFVTFTFGPEGKPIEMQTETLGVFQAK